MDLVSWKESLTPPEVLFDSLIIVVSTLAWVKDVAASMILIGQHKFQAKSNYFFLLGTRGILVHKKYDYQSLSFIPSVAPLLAGLDNTLTESRKNTSIAPLLVSLVSTLAELLASPLYAGSLSLLLPYYVFFKIFIFSFYFLFFKELYIGTYLFQRRKLDPDLLRSE